MMTQSTCTAMSNMNKEIINSDLTFKNNIFQLHYFGSTSQQQLDYFS
jgi:hypothetical protein